jgi:hypothetical protein
MAEHIASTLIVVPNWAIWLAFGMWVISTLLSVTKMMLHRNEE